MCGATVGQTLWLGRRKVAEDGDVYMCGGQVRTAWREAGPQKPLVTLFAETLLY